MTVQIERSVDLISPRNHEAITLAMDLLMHRLGNKVSMSGGKASWGDLQLTTTYTQEVMHIHAAVPVTGALYETGAGDTP